MLKVFVEDLVRVLLWELRFRPVVGVNVHRTVVFFDVKLTRIWDAHTATVEFEEIGSGLWSNFRLDAPSIGIFIHRRDSPVSSCIQHTIIICTLALPKSMILASGTFLASIQVHVYPCAAYLTLILILQRSKRVYYEISLWKVRGLKLLTDFSSESLVSSFFVCRSFAIRHHLAHLGRWRLFLISFSELPPAVRVEESAVLKRVQRSW